MVCTGEQWIAQDAECRQQNTGIRQPCVQIHGSRKAKNSNPTPAAKEALDVVVRFQKIPVYRGTLVAFHRHEGPLLCIF